ncbi:sigma factor-like helix-turn-helix DNA-binding protein [Cellulomonas xylanilytica]|uniref:DNA-directed RNA polymerase sigma-70 factor n=1 Tax=Cellulomonas xylanilytica TaxID=233583 RepID=A0A510V8J6_9CELL|nr:sigma factor-like helix-turn-helix DNA-binding protein [Cellulomonas xylanilytica]GEK23096.1 DNA-directed RNA polymerase sigma-70 factor [Cellulomonas xylanilytica]
MSRWEPLLEQMVEERYSQLVARAMLLCSSRSDAEDVVQEALLSTFSGRARFTTVAEAEQYVRRAIVSRFIDGTRRRGRERALANQVGHAPLVAVPPSGGVADRLEAALAQLSPRQRACVVLRYLDDVPVRETAALLGVSDGAVKRYTADGIRMLNDLLGTQATVNDHTVQVLTSQRSVHDA